MISQNVLGRKTELQADEQFSTTMSTYHDIEQVMKHLSAQDAELLRHAQLLMHLRAKNGISLEQVAAEGATTTQLDTFIHSQSAEGAAAPPAPAQGKKESA
jgi:flagellar biosynthesis chaperone FliJ